MSNFLTMGDKFSFLFVFCFHINSGTLMPKLMRMPEIMSRYIDIYKSLV